MDILTGENLSLIWTSFIGKFVYLVGGEGMGWMEGIVILASYKYHFIKVHKNVMQHPTINISIISFLLSHHEIAKL